MKFNSNKSAVLSLFGKDLYPTLRIPTADVEISILYPEINELWKKYSNEFKTQMFYATGPFLQQLEEKVMKMTSDFEGDLKSTLISKMKGAATIVTKLSTKCFYSDPENAEFCLFDFAHVEQRLTLGCFVYDWESDKNSKLALSSKLLTQEANGRITAYDTFAQILATYYYIVNAEPTTKFIVPANKKATNEKGEKFLNETSFPLEILDERWYSDIVRSDPFKVKEFKRQQHYGPRRSLVKEIIIEAFWKKGYTSKARGLKNPKPKG